jgi:Flp pilus assembly protein TadG
MRESGTGKLAMSATDSRLIHATSGFRHDDRGTIAVIFALSVFVLVMVTGLAIDIGRLTHSERALSSAVDAAALAAAKSMRGSNLSDAEVEAVAQKYFEANIQGSGGSYATIQSFSVNINRDKSSVAVEVQSDVPMLFASVGGIEKISLPKSSVAVFESKNIEVGIQLDVTGSMCSPCTKIVALQDAVAGPDGLLDVLMPDGGSTNEVRIGLAPFAAGVNAGPYASAVSGGRAGADGCVYERVDATVQATDTLPIGTARFKGHSEISGASVCPTSANSVVGLTDSKSDLRHAVNGLTTGGLTAGHLGATWAWGIVSPAWASIWGGVAPAPYKDGKTEKYVILMTDGIYNTVGGRSNGDTGSTARQSQRFAEDTCTSMKAQGIVVYTIGFQAPNAAKADLRACATTASKFYDAADASTLRAAFRAIAEEINSLRLSS